MLNVSQFNVVPLPSTALTNRNSSAHTSHADNTAFDTFNNYSEQCQLELLHFQRYHSFQRQQRQMALTAAAVAGPSESPYILLSDRSSAGQSRPVTTSKANSPSGGTVETPSSAYFSPLASPALVQAPARGQSSDNHQQVLLPVGSHQHSAHHPLSALPSPALNSIRLSRGARETLSSAYGPQDNTDMADPAYISQIGGEMGGAQDPNQGQKLDQMQKSTIDDKQYTCSRQYHDSSVVLPDGQASNLASPLLRCPSSAEPQGSSLPYKPRPSASMKPSHRTHTRQASLDMGMPSFGLATPGNMLLIDGHLLSPPEYQKIDPDNPGMRYLRPAAIDLTGVARRQNTFQSGAPSVSSPSPVDLAHFMPPPPVPTDSSNHAQKEMKPITPTSLLNPGPGIAFDESADPSSSSNGKRLPTNKTSTSGGVSHNGPRSEGTDREESTCRERGSCDQPEWEEGEWENGDDYRSIRCIWREQVESCHPTSGRSGCQSG